MTSKRFYLSARLQGSILLAFRTPPAQPLGGRGGPAARERTAVDPPNVVYAGARTVDGRAAATGRPRDNNNKEAPHINTQPFSVAEGFEAGGKSFTGSFSVL